MPPSMTSTCSMPYVVAAMPGIRPLPLAWMRDLFYVMQLCAHEGTTPAILRALVVYLARHNRLVDEVQFPSPRELQQGLDEGEQRFLHSDLCMPWMSADSGRLPQRTTPWPRRASSTHGVSRSLTRTNISPPDARPRPRPPRSGRSPARNHCARGPDHDDRHRFLGCLPLLGGWTAYGTRPQARRGTLTASPPPGRTPWRLI